MDGFKYQHLVAANRKHPLLQPITVGYREARTMRSCIFPE